MSRAPRATPVARLARALTVVTLLALLTPWLGTGGSAGAQESPDDGVKITRNVVMATTDAGPLTVDVYQPATAGTGRPAVVLVHGGAWFQGAPADMDEQGRLLARQGWVGFSISYRLAKLGQPTWPGNLTDVQRGIRWVAANAPTYGADPERLAVIGSSAGAHLTALVASVGTGVPGPDEPALPTSTLPAAGVVSAGAGPALGATPVGPPTTAATPTPQLVKAVALWSPPTELLDLVPEGENPPASCGDNPYCRTFWTVPFIPTMLGCGPTECHDRYESASLPVHVTAATVPTWLANSEDEIIPIGQFQSLADALGDNRVDTQVKVLPGHQHANEYTSAVWNDMVPFLSTRLGVTAPTPITFAAANTGPDLGLILAVVGVIVLAGASFAAVVVLQRREPSASARPGT